MAFRIADGVTRRALKEGAPVVAFLVRRNNRYPYDENPDKAPIAPCDLYTLESLPIFGEYDGYGGVSLDKGDDSVAVKVALAQAGGLSWKQLMACGIGDSYQLLSKPGDENKRAYGLFIVHQDTFQRVCKSAWPAVDSDEVLAQQQGKDVAVVVELVNRYLALCNDDNKAYTEKRSREVYLGIQICSLRTSVGFAADGTELDMPELARVLESRDIFGEDFKETLDALKYLTNMPDRAPKPRTVDDVPQYKELLEALWMTQRFYHGLDLFDVTVTPSKRTSGEYTAVKLRLAIADAEALVREQLDWARENGGVEDLPKLDALVQSTQDLADRLSWEMQDARTAVMRNHMEDMEED